MQLCWCQPASAAVDSPPKNRCTISSRRAVRPSPRQTELSLRHFKGQRERQSTAWGGEGEM
ncbi:uncharacterized, partial [Tachysurus ichikawai]